MSQRRGWSVRAAGGAAVLAMVLWSTPSAYAAGPTLGGIDMVVEGAPGARVERSAVATAGERQAVVLEARGSARRYAGHARGSMLAV